MIGLAFIIAELSWRFVERPILALKRKPFPAIGYLGERDRDRKTSGDRATVTA
jgi:peptidoglycan/LPS O-acetylase OafA/YrhL